MLGIPLSQTPSQAFQIVLNGQDCNIELLTRGERLYMNLAVDGEDVQNGAVCINQVPIIQIPTSRFSGNMMFVDTLGDTNPSWTGLDGRYQLVYLTQDELDNG